MMETSRLHGGEVDPRGAWRGTRTMFKDGSTKLGFTTEEFSVTHRWRDGPAKGKDWTELMSQTRPQKEDVIRNLLESMKQPVDQKKGVQRTCADKEAWRSASP